MRILHTKVKQAKLKTVSALLFLLELFAHFVQNPHIKFEARLNQVGISLPLLMLCQNCYFWHECFPIPSDSDLN